MSARHHKIDRDPTKSFPPASADESFDRTLRWLSPLPAPDRRWQAALALVAEPRSDKRGSANADVAEAVEYLRAVANCATDGERAAAAEKWPAINEAHSLFKQGGPKRWEIEAWLVTTESDEAIAERCGLASAVVVAYRKWFFSVGREYREDPDLLRRKLFAHLVSPYFRFDELGPFWTWIALTGGPETLDLLVKAFYTSWLSNTPPTLSTYFRSEAEVPLVIQAFVARFVLRPCTKTMPAIFTFALMVIEADRGDPRERQEKLDDLFRLTVAYTLAYLDGQPSSTLQRILRQPQRQMNLGEQSLSPSIPGDAMELMKSAAKMYPLLETAKAEGQSVARPAKPEMKPLHTEMMELLELGGMLSRAASGGECGRE